VGRWNYFRSIPSNAITAPSDLNITDGQTGGHCGCAVKIRRQIIADIIGITDILRQRYQYNGPSLLTSRTASHTQTTQYFGNYIPDVTHIVSPFYGPVHACRSAQRCVTSTLNTLSTIHAHRYIGGSSTTHSRLTPLPKEPSRISLMYLIFLETRIIHLHFPPDSLCLSSFNFFLVGAATSRKTFLFLKEGHFCPSRSSKVTDRPIGASQKRICDFLLVRNSNFGPILHRFWARTRFMCSLLLTAPLFNPNFGGVPVAPDRRCWASTSELHLHAVIRFR